MQENLIVALNYIEGRLAKIDLVGDDQYIMGVVESWNQDYIKLNTGQILMENVARIRPLEQKDQTQKWIQLVKKVREIEK